MTKPPSPEYDLYSNPALAGSEALRAAVLRRASELICGERASTYGHPSINLSCAQELIDVYLSYEAGRGRSLPNHGPAHRNAIIQALNKIARIATGVHHLDNYIDAAAYIAIAGEVAVALPSVPSELSHTNRDQQKTR